MLQVAFLCLFVGQVPSPPAPHPPENYAQSPSSVDVKPHPPQRYEQSPSYPSTEQPPADPTAQREWLIFHLVDDLEAQGKLDAQKYREVERMVKNVSDSQVGELVDHYKAQELAAAQANLRRLQAYRDRLKLEVARQSQVHEQEQAITAYGSALAAQQGQWAMQNFYAALAWPYYFAPYRHRHHHHW